MASSSWNPSKTPLLDLAREEAQKRLAAGQEDPRCLSLLDQTILAVSSAQGVIDNGGFRYFFEADWPGNPPYSFFSDAYRRIGAEEPARCIDEAAALFPFRQPERHKARRNRFLDSLPETHPWFQLDRVCGDVTVWEKLERYVKDHSGH